ncbi:MAG: hypothetical protein AAGA87_08580 [Pseudomonadota bacterium]
MAKPKLAYVIDPRFPGGTSAAVARELPHAAEIGHLSVHALETKMFKGRDAAPVLTTALDDLGLPLTWEPPAIEADVVVVHNPSCLKFNDTFASRIVCRKLIVVTHENFVRPGGVDGFDVARCLGHLDRCAVAVEKILAPISDHNRACIEAWFANNDRGGWTLDAANWPNICDFEAIAPTATPRDRRGRHSRPGLEKFPSLADLDACFPPHAEANILLGADPLLDPALERPHWTVHPFQAMSVADYLSQIDFLVYFTAPTWRESFGRVLAEASFAGKAVLTDADTAASLGGGAIVVRPDEVDAAITCLCADPKAYADAVKTSQSHLAKHNSAAAFRSVLDAALA